MADKQNGAGPAPKMTKLDAVGKALAELGNDAKPAAIQAYVKDHFGMEMSLAHAKTAKNSFLRRAAAKKKAAPPQEQPAGNANGRGHMAEPKISKLEAVRRAMAELGNKAKRGDIQAFIKEKFGSEMSPDHISTSKGEILRKARQARKPAAKAARKEETARPQPQAAPAPPPAVWGGFGLEDLAAVKALLEKAGAERMRGLIELLSSW